MDYENYRNRCAYCGLFVSWEADSYTNFGCSSYDPPEPHDPEFLCPRHSNELYLDFLKGFKNGSRSGDWQKSNAEIKAAKECNLVWCNGIGTLGTKNWEDGHKYISKERYDELKDLPYYGWCECGAVRKGGYCSVAECEKSFERKNEKYEIAKT